MTYHTVRIPETLIRRIRSELPGLLPGQLAGFALWKHSETVLLNAYSETLTRPRFRRAGKYRGVAVQCNDSLSAQWNGLKHKAWAHGLTITELTKRCILMELEDKPEKR